TIDRLLADTDLKLVWERYHLIGRVLRHEHVNRDAAWVASQVRDRLTSENVVPITPRPATGRLRSAAPLATALAAGLALVAVFLVPLGPVDVVDPPALDRQGRSLIAESDRRWQRDDPLLRGRLDQLVINHHERAPGPGLSGLVSYAAVVGYESRQ
ncbi:MAG: RseA family anti-sigma factor, partial [Thiohalocapsa sp.]